jgi:class 3 adenylate cyclase
MDLADRFGDLAAWSDPNKCLFVAVACLLFTLCYTAFWLYTTRNPDYEPYVDYTVLPAMLWLQAFTILAWSIVAAWSLAWRRRLSAPALVGVTHSVFTFQLAYTGYFFGAHTNPFPGMTIIGAWTLSLVMFPARVVVVAVTVWWLVLLATTFADQAGVIPYAPLYRAGPVENGHLHPAWLLGPGGVTIVLMALIQLFVYVIIQRWHDRERALAIISKDLTQANDVISRYVASQLAEQIRAGNYTALERHERRRLTLFFSDIQDFAATADLIEPEDLSHQLNQYLSAMTGVAERYGATIDKFVGDAIMIFFGAPASMSDRDQALRAVRMAVEMQERLTALRDEWSAAGLERPFHVRMGINTGQASVGAFGSQSRLEYTAIGRQVNLAARLQAQCEPDRILLSHSTYVLVRDEIECAARGEISVKGFHQPVKVYEVLPRSPGQHPLTHPLAEA